MSTTPAGAERIESLDVVELILADHREFERLLRALRNREEDRRARRAELADLLVAHAEAEEEEVYPALKRQAPEEAEEIEHGRQEHSEGHAALLELMEVADVAAEAFEEKLEELSEAITHHLDEEERDVLNAARENVAEDRRNELGEAFLRARRRHLDSGAGGIDNVRRLVQEAREAGELQ